jgi:putative membrane protein
MKPRAGGRPMHHVIALAAWAIFLGYLLVSKEISRYLGPRTYWVVIVGAVVFALAAAALLVVPRRPGTDPVSLRDALGTIVLLIPLVAVAAIPNADLGALAASRRSPLGGPTGSSLLVPAPKGGDVSFIDVHFANESAAYAAEAGVGPGVPVDLTGFVSEETAGPGDSFELSRFYISCCAADAIPYSVTVLQRGSERRFAEDTWLRVAGTLEQTGNRYVVSAQSVVRVNEPNDPYLY